MKTNKEDFEETISKCFAELFAASKEKYDSDKAERTAAMFLSAQIQLAYFIADIELKSRYSKNDIARIEAIKYFEIKENATGKKYTEAALEHSTAKDSEVIEAKRSNSEAEADLKKYNYIMGSLKDGHIYFRSLSKKSWNE